jgi:hypothetical protein
MITVEKQFPSGYYVVSAMVSGHGGMWLHTERYGGYNKRDSVRLFRESLKTQGYTLVRGY